VTSATRTLLIANVAVFLLQSVTGDRLIAAFALWPLGGADTPGGISFQPWQIVTYSFLHGGVMHLLLNMLALWMFGTDVERVVGSRRFVLYYFVCVVSAGICQLLISSLAAETAYPVIGASGGVFGGAAGFRDVFSQTYHRPAVSPDPAARLAVRHTVRGA